MFSNLDSPTEKVVMLGIYNQEEAEDQDAEIEKEFEGVQSWVDKQEKDVENISKTHPFSKGREHIDLDNLKKLTLKMQKDALHIKADAEVSLGHKRTFNIYISESLSSNYWVLLLEALSCIGLSILQMYFIKRMMENKMIV